MPMRNNWDPIPDKSILVNNIFEDDPENVGKFYFFDKIILTLLTGTNYIQNKKGPENCYEILKIVTLRPILQIKSKEKEQLLHVYYKHGYVGQGPNFVLSKFCTSP
jgi:hypothetical protein